MDNHPEPNSHSGDPLGSSRERLKELNTKAYYLLVALSFLCFHESASADGAKNGISFPLKWALTLTGVAAILPLQDFFESQLGLDVCRWVKIVLLFAALPFTLVWIWADLPAWWPWLASGIAFCVLLCGHLTRKF